MMSFKMALRSISSNKMRSALTMLGIIIGVMALVVLISIANSAVNSVTGTLSDLSKNMLAVGIFEEKGTPLELDTVNSWMDQDDIGLVAPIAEAPLTARSNGENHSVTAFGVTPAFYEVLGMELTVGRFLRTADVQNRSYVCVINETAATKLIGYKDCVGQAIALNGVEYTIVGVLKDDESMVSFTSPGTICVYLPYTSLLRLSDSMPSAVTIFFVSVPEGGTIESTEAAIKKLLMEHFSGNDKAFEVLSLGQLEESMREMKLVMSILLGGIAAISLIVGGIGIMNIMLVTVTERTREIGIRKAIGASKGSILSQFLVEAVVLCMLGCGLGIFLSWGILHAVTTIASSLKMTFSLNGGAVLISVLFCFIIGMVFGLYPANKAAKMKPIDALHYGG